MKFTQLVFACIFILGFTFCKKKTEEILTPSIIETPPIEVNYSLSKRFVKSNEVIQFKNYTKNADRYEWDFGDGETSILESPEHSYKTKGTYTISLNAFKGNQRLKRDTIVRCDYTASITFTLTYSDYTPPTNWPSHLYIRFDTFLYDSENSASNIKYFYSIDYYINNPNKFVCTFQLTDEKIKYKVKTNTFINGMTTGPDPNFDYVIRDFEGPCYTDSFDLFKGLPDGYNKSSRLKYVTINCFASQIQYN